MKSAHPLRTRLEFFALIWRVILSVLGLASGWYFHNWLLGAGIFVFAQITYGFFAIGWLRLILGKEGYTRIAVEIALEDELPPE
jgi:hypothetical protein